MAENLNFTKAAARLRLAQPAVSRQVADLEEEIGVDLLSRSSRGVTLTEEGKLFLVEARAALSHIDETVAKVRALARGEFGELQVGYVPPLDLHILPQALAEFRKGTPGVAVTLHDSGTDEICRDLRAGKLHLALMMQPSEELQAGIEFEEIGRYPFFVALAPSHPLARMKTVSREALGSHSLVVLDRKRNSEFHRILKRVLAPRMPNVGVESDSVNSLITEVGSGRCVAVVSQLFKEAVGKRLLYRKLVDAGAEMVIGVARAKKGDMPPAGEKLCATIRKLGRG